MHKRYLAQPGVEKKIIQRVDRAVKRVAEEKERLLRREKREAARKEKQLRSKKWRLARPRKEKQENFQQKSPAWVADWLKQQVENYLRENAGHFERRGTNFWAMTEDQVINLCRIIYMAKCHHNDKRGYQPHDNYARREGSRAVREGDGLYLDRPISPELKGLTR